MAIDFDALDEKLIGEQSPPSSLDLDALDAQLSQGTEASASYLMQADFSPGNYAPKMLRWSLARGDNLKEKQLRLKKKYPEGDLRVLPESVAMGFDDDMLIFRESPQAQWKAVEPQGYDKFDIPEAIAGSFESIVGEAVMALNPLTAAARKVATVPMTVFRQVTGALAGEAVEQAGQTLTGVQAQTAGAIAWETAQEGIYSGIGGFAMSPFVAASNVARGAGSLKVGEEGLAVINAAKELDPKIAKGLTPGLVTDNPAIRLSEAQSSALLPGLPRRYKKLIEGLDSAVRSSAPGNAATAMNDTTTALKNFGNYFLARLQSSKTLMSDGGKALQEGIKTYSEASRLVVKGLYDKARGLEEPVFNWDPVLMIADDLQAGSKGVLDPAVKKQIEQLRVIDGPIELSDGVLSVTDQIRNIRTQLHALSHVKPGEVATQATGQANDLNKALKGVLENPSNADPGFKGAWKAANDAASERMAKLEAAPIIAAAKHQNPAELVKTYAKAGQVDNLLTIRNTIPQKDWDKFVHAAYSDLLSDPANLSTRLRAFDTETLDVFMPRADQVLWKNIAVELDRIYKVGADTIAERQVTNRNFIDKIISSAEPRDAQTLIRAANHTNNKQLRQSVRAAIVEWAWDGVVKKTKNGLGVNQGALVEHVKSLKKSGLWRVLSVEERKIIGNAEIVGRAFQNVADAGTSIQAAEAVSGIKKLQATAMMTFLRAELLAQFYLSPAGRRILIGSGLPNSNGGVLRLVGGALVQMSPTEDIGQLLKEQKEKNKGYTPLFKTKDGAK